VNRRTVLHETLAQLDFDGAGSRLPVTVAGVRVDLLTRNPRLYARMERYFSAFQGLGGEPGECQAEVSLEPIADESLWDDADPEFHLDGTKVVQRDFAAKRLTPQRAVARVTAELDDSIHNLLRWFLPSTLLGNGCLLMHGAGVVKDGQGYVFFGQSGAGKSTTISLITSSDPHAVPLGDDAVIIQMKGSVPWLHAAPLGSGYTRDAPPAISAPIAGIYSLSQSKEVRLERLSPAEAVAALLASAMSLGFDESLTERFELAEKFARAGVDRLSFRKSSEFWGLILSHGNDKGRDMDV
jgi:hypothetical protein